MCLQKKRNEKCVTACFLRGIYRYTNCLPTMTLLAVIPWCLAFSVAAGNVPDISDIRLVNGSGPYGGRVEIQINGTWRTVCDDTFDFSVATVMCKMMNLKASTYMTGARYGQGLGPIFANEFNCDGNERHLNECSYVSNGQCTHARNIGIICSECPQIDIRNGNVVDISPEGNVLSVMCNDGFTSNTLKSNCSNGTWSPPSLKCIHDITDIRLVNGVGLYDGRVELLVNGTWGTICGTSFKYKEANAICRIIFGSKFNSIWNEEFYTTSTIYGPGDGPICMDNLDCDSSATSINECSYNLDVSCTDHTRDVAVACHVSPLNITDTRLVNGTGPYDGRIELFVDGYWRTICNRHIKMYDAQTICNTRNASLAAYFTTTTYGEGTGLLLINEIRCGFQARDHIRDCNVKLPYRTIYDPYCTHDYDLSVVCTPCGLPKIYNGEAFSFKNTELTVKCQSGFFPDFIKMRCLDNGTWAEDQRCTSFYAYPLDISEIRLTSSFGYYRFGRVELFVNGTWGTVCDTDFDQEAAAVVCRMLGLEYENIYTNADRFGSTGAETIFVDKLNCNGSERHVNNCTYEISNYCTHYNDVAVACTGFHLNITDIRLADGPQPSQGRVEIKYMNTWGTICHRDFGKSEANLICRMVGYTSAQSFHDGWFYGDGKGPIFVDDLDCKENATDLNDCTYNVNHSCFHRDDVSVVCTGCGDPTPENGFVNTSSTTYQTVVHVTCDKDYKLLGEENIICQADWTWSNRPVCKRIDCGDPTPKHGSSNISATANGAVALIECEEGYDLTGEAIITCQLDETWTDTPFCVIKDCGDATPENGFVNTVSTTYQSVVRVTCDKGYKLIGDEYIICQHNATWSNKPTCKFIDCGNPTPKKGFVNTESTTYQSVVHVTCDMGYKLIGEEYIICQHNATWSNKPVCKLIDCDDPTPVHGSSNSSVTTNGTIALIECEMGYTLIGESIITCQQDETWTDTPSCFTKEAVGGDLDKLIIILTVCIGSFAVAIIGLVIVKTFRKRNSTPRTVQKSIAATGNEADTYHHVDNPTNIQQTDRGSETNMYESLREVDQQTSMTQSHYDMLTPTEKHYQKLDHHTMETKETSSYEDLAL